jgi:tetratricopeptide (TPR) repeat protein
MSIETLKEEARRSEQREAWQRALDLYLTAIAKLESADEPDITLYNRVGDLYTRLNRLDEAIEHYESAIALYMDAGLPNNAIAVCKKILRSSPNRASAFLNLGKIWAEQGFIPDARQNFLTYAELKMQAGDADEAFRALVEFADLAPDEVGVRIAVSDQMEAHGRTAAAAEQLRQARLKLLEVGREEEARQLEARILELDPDALLEDLPAQDPDDSDAVEPSDEGQGSHGVLGFETTALAAPPAEEAEPVSASEPGLEARPESEPTPDATEAGETGSPPVEEIQAREPATEPSAEAEALDGEPEEDPTPLPTLDLDGDDSRPVVGESAPLAEGSTTPAEAPAAQPGDVGLGTPRPTPRDLRTDDESEVRLSARDEAAALLVRGQDLLSLGHVEEGLAALDRAHRGFAEADDLAQAMRVVREMILHDPGEVDHHQRLVEYAFRFEDHDLLVPAYLGLADCLSRKGDEDRAEAILGQVLQIDPHNERALQGLRDRPAPDPEEKPAVASSTDYVDLGSLILDHEREKTTRWTVAADAPSGDEDADFKKMLAQFKAKVAENLDLQDVRAHYDLGTAYKEMGLLDEAIAEFQAALRADPSHLPTYELLGQCFLDLGKSEVAIRSLGRALHLSPGIEDEMLGIYYNLGRAHENVGNVDDAMEFYEKVFALDINFMDVTERLRGLR